MQIIELAKDAARTIWRNKALWFFGVFVAGGGGGGGGGTGGGGANGTGAAGTGMALPTWFWPLMAGLMVFGVVVFLLHVISEAALIEGVRRERRDGERLGVRTGLRAGLRHFWRVLGLKVGFGAVMLVTVALVALPALLGVLEVWPVWLGATLTVLLALPAAPWLLTAYFIYEYGLRFCVLDGRGVRAGAERAYRFLHGRIVESLKLLLVVAAGRIAGAVLALTLLVPVAALALGLYFAAGLPAAMVVGAGLGLPWVLVVSGATGAFGSTVWTLGVLQADASA